MRAMVVVSATCGLAMLGCNKAPSCEEVIDRMAEKMEVKLDDADQRRDLIKICKEEFSASRRKCLMAAKNVAAIHECHERDPREQAKAAAKEEATTNIRKIYEGARSYFLEPATRGQGFPISTPETPPAGACCASPGKKCAPNPALWTGSWNDLKFEIDEPHQYSYTFVSSGTGSRASFTITATGDLDCDGVYSTFEMVGSIADDGSVTGSAGSYKNNELE